MSRHKIFCGNLISYIFIIGLFLFINAFNFFRNFEHPFLTLQPNHLSVLENDHFDNRATLMTSKNYNEKSILRGDLLGNRQGLAGMSVWGVACAEPPVNQGFEILGPKHTPVEITSFNNKCTYTRSNLGTDFFWHAVSSISTSPVFLKTMAGILFAMGAIGFWFFFKGLMGYSISTVATVLFVTSKAFLQQINHLNFNPLAFFLLPVILNTTVSTTAGNSAKSKMAPLVILQLFIQSITHYLIFFVPIYVALVGLIDKQNLKKWIRQLLILLLFLGFFILVRLSVNLLYWKDMGKFFEDIVSNFQRYDIYKEDFDLTRALRNILDHAIYVSYPGWIWLVGLIALFTTKNYLKGFCLLFAGLSFAIVSPGNLLRHAHHVFFLSFPFVLFTLNALVMQLFTGRLLWRGLSFAAVGGIIFFNSQYLYGEWEWYFRYKEQVKMIKTNVKISEIFVSTTDKSRNAYELLGDALFLADGIYDHPAREANVFHFNPGVEYTVTIFLQESSKVNLVNIISKDNPGSMSCGNKYLDIDQKMNSFDKTLRPYTDFGYNFRRYNVLNINAFVRAIQFSCTAQYATNITEVEVIGL